MGRSSHLGIARAFPAALAIAFLATPVHAGWQAFTNSSGLAGDLILNGFQDPAGIYWFATAQGLSRYDGLHWRTIALPGGSGQLVRDAVQDSAGGLWVFGSANLMRFDGSQWRTFGTQDGLRATDIRDIDVGPDGRVWVAASNFVSVWDGSIWQNFTVLDGIPDRRMYVVHVARDGMVWVGTYGGIARWDGASWRAFTTADGLPADRTEHLFEGRDGTLWAGTEDGSARWDGNEWALDPNFGTITHGPFMEDHAGRMWVGTTFGVVRWDGHQLRTFELPPAQASARILGLFPDRAGNVWVVTSLGALRYDGAGWTQQVGPVVSQIDRDDRNIWIATQGNGLMGYDGQQWVSFELVTPLATAVKVDSRGDVWVGDNGWGVHRFVGGSSKGRMRWSTFDGLPSDFINGIGEATDGSIWVATNQGAARFDGVGWRAYTAADGLASNVVRCLFRDRAGNLWFGGDGLTRFDGSQWLAFTPPVRSTIWSIGEDLSGNLWLGQQGAIQSFDGTTWTTYPVPTGIGTNFVHAIVRDSTGAMWFATDFGVLRHDGQAWRTFTVGDGLINDATTGAVVTRDGQLCFGSGWSIGPSAPTGLSFYDIDAVPPITVFDQPPPALATSRNPLATFRAAFGEISGIEFATRLDSGPWSAWTASDVWTGSGLEDGVHTLEARSRDAFGNVDSLPPRVAFEIDATGPAPSIDYPTRDLPVRGTLTVVGSTLDARLSNWTLWRRPASSAPWAAEDATLLMSSSRTVRDSDLVAFDTGGLEEGPWELRLEVRDTLGLTGVAQTRFVVDNVAPFAAQTAPALVTALEGGHVYTTHGEAHLYFPPGGFVRDATVRVDPVAPADVPETLPDGAVRLVPGFEVSWGDVALGSPALIELAYTAPPSMAAGDAGAAGDPPVLYRRSDGTTWERVGGTWDAAASRTSAAFTAAGRYALFRGAGVGTGALGLSVLSLTPRVFAPRGTFGNPELAIGFTLGRSASVTVKVYNRAGRLIRVVTEGASFAAGANIVRWNGRDRDGASVTEGLYLVTVEALGETRDKAVAVVR